VSAKLAAELGVKDTLVKNQSQNPTWFFKDAGTFVGIQRAISPGYRRMGTVPAGYTAPSVAAYGAEAGLETLILVIANLPT
jgi:threonine synthase